MELPTGGDAFDFEGGERVRMTAEEVIERLQLIPLPGEGGWFRETWRSVDEVMHPTHGQVRALGTSILYLLKQGERSVLHRLAGPEVYFHQSGAPLEMLILGDPAHPLGGRVVLGPPELEGAVQQVVVPGGVWQGSRVLGEGKWTLVGTAMAPGFDFGDWTGANEEELVALYPLMEELIRVLAKR